MSRTVEKSISIYERKIFRFIFGGIQEKGTWRSGSNLELHQSYKESDIINSIKVKRSKWAASHREEKLCDNSWILDSGTSCHMAKESVWFKNISPEVMDIYLADKNSKMMSQGTGNVSSKTMSTKHCNSINLTITNGSNVPQLRCSNYLAEIENEAWDIDSFFEVSTERNENNQNTENGVSSNFEINNGPVAIENDKSIPL
ncbi:retrovirus-related Pol polyprotein from transposon TNT 1-94 [Trichonephila clavipes]|nr:retrovirus-related Pol polyprotein from transposon TNT 1-94 [Trichonephila clavipes]